MSEHVVNAYDKRTGEHLGKESDSVSYNPARINFLLNRVSQKSRQNTALTVLPYDLSFKSTECHPQDKPSFPPPDDDEFNEIMFEFISDEAKKEINDHCWSSDSKNKTGARDLVLKGQASPPFMKDILIEDIDKLNDDDFLEYFDYLTTKEEFDYSVGCLHSYCKNTLGDDGEVKLFEVPKNVSDSGFLNHLKTINPPNGKTHDYNVNPEIEGVSGTCQDRRTIMDYTGEFLFEKCQNVKYHYEKYRENNAAPGFYMAASLVEEFMHKEYKPISIMTSFGHFKKVEVVKRKKLDNNWAQRSIFAAGHMDGIMGKLLFKNITLSSFKRGERGNAHGTESSEGGFRDLFEKMMKTRISKEAWDKFKVDFYDGNELTLKDLLRETGWSDADVEKWDLSQFPHYMIENLFYYMLCYDWPKVLDVDHFVWLYLIIQLATIDTTIVSNFGNGVELFMRVLASGFFLTAAAGSKTHDKLNSAFNFRQFWEATKVKNELVKQGEEGRISSLIVNELLKSYNAFLLNNSFIHFSDDAVTMAWRRGLVWTEMVDKSSYFANNFMLSIKNEPRNWSFEVGQTELDMVNENRSIFTVLKYSDDLIEEKERKIQFDGVKDFYIKYGYSHRVKHWLPLTSEADENGLLTKGAQFLKFYFVEHERDLGDVIVTEILPVRPHLDVYPKLRFCKQKYDTPFKRLIQIKQLAFFLWPWEKEFNCLKKIHDTYLQKNWPKMKDTIVTPELKQDFDLWFGFIKANSVMLQVFPDRYDVRAFFFP